MTGMKWINVVVRLMLLCVALLLLHVAGVAAGVTVIGDDCDVKTYDCYLTLHADKALAAGSQVAVYVEADEKFSSGIRITVSAQALVVEVVGDAVHRRDAYATFAGLGGDFALTVARRNELLYLLHDGKLIGAVAVPRLAGARAGAALGAGWQLTNARLQRLEPVFFSDDFMRSNDDINPWQVVSGRWNLKSAWDATPFGNTRRFEYSVHAQNPFSLMGGNPQGGALCMTGYPFWEDYTITAAIHPVNGDAIGLMVNMPSQSEGILARWSAAGSADNRLALYRVHNGQQTLLAESAGGFFPGVWYKFSVSTSWGSVKVIIDDAERLSVTDVTPFRGGVGLYAEGGGGVEFDDISVYGKAINTQRVHENQLVQISDFFKFDGSGMQTWANIDGWRLLVALPAYWVSKNELLRNSWLTLTTVINKGNAGELWLALGSDGKTTTSGSRVVIKRNAGGLTQYDFYHDLQLLGSKTGEAFEPDTEYSFRLTREGNNLRFEQDDRLINTWEDPAALPGAHAGYRVTGIFAKDPQVLISDGSMLDYVFSKSPVDWLTTGSWAPTVRWSCEPSWSFLSGWSRGEAVLWSKKRFSGDHAIQAFLGLNMEYPRERAIYDQRYRDFCLTLCGNGWDPRSGYSAIYGAAASDGSHDKAVLLRDGVQVASVPLLMPTRNNAHRQWFDLELRRQGSTVTFLLAGAPLLVYDDQHPIPGGIPAVWTYDNCIAVARVRLRYKETPQTNTKPYIGLAEPAYPEWANIQQPLALMLTPTRAITGNPISYQTTVRQAPALTSCTVTPTASGLQFTPSMVGEYWLQCHATDGKLRSPNVNIALPAFNPAAGRDDSHVLLLYRFLPDNAESIRDESAHLPAANLQINSTEKSGWLPKQGLQLGTTSSLRGTEDVSKLCNLTKTNAFSLECWFSTDTVNPANNRTAGLFAWESDVHQRQLAVGIYAEKIVLLTDPGARWEDTSNPAFGGLCSSLLHLVVTWNGREVACYLNGKLAGKQPLAWSTAQLTHAAPIWLGNDSSSAFPFQGRFYLFALHDCCLTEQQILRHYHTGPSANH